MASRPLAIIDPSASRSVARFGKGGEGPGELSNDVVLSESGNGEFVILDRTNHQVHRYARSGEWLGSERLELDGSPLAGGIRRGPRGGQFLVFLLNQNEAARWYELAAIDAASASSKLFLRFPAPPSDAEPGSIHRGRQLWTVLGNNVITMWSARPVVTVFDGRGRLARRIDLPLSQSRLTARDIEREVARVGAIARRLEPGPRPLTNMLYAVNDTVFGIFLSNLWHAAEDPALPPETFYWRLFTVRGEYLGVVEQPEDFWLLGHGQGTIWARILDGNGYPVLTELEVHRATSTAKESDQ